MKKSNQENRLMIIHRRKCRIAMLLAVALAATAIFGGIVPVTMQTAAAAEQTLRNPRIVADETMSAKQKVSYDTVWFGSYPQSEVVSTDSVYVTLKNLPDESFSPNGDVTIKDAKYRRIKKSDASYQGSYKTYYQWDNEYHYFRYEPVRWRVLSSDGVTAMLMSDAILDSQPYVYNGGFVTWETSTLRSWMNGYGAQHNYKSIDYTDNNMLGSAFTAAEQTAICTTTVDNTNPYKDCGNNTEDKLYLLQMYEVYNASAVANAANKFGFISSREQTDEARQAAPSDYAHAMGTPIYVNSLNGRIGSYWWLRTPGYDKGHAGIIDSGAYYYDGWENRLGYVGIRPVLHLDLSKKSYYSYAGVVCTNGTDTEVGGDEPGVSDEPSGTSVPSASAIPSEDVMPSEGTVPSASPSAGSATQKPDNTPAPSAVMLRNPRLAEDFYDVNGEKKELLAYDDYAASWDCVYFGSYPQTEVASTQSVYASLLQMAQQDDQNKNNSQAAFYYDANGDVEIDGVKYHKVAKSDATYTAGRKDYWTDEYHFFKYEPVKWRVLSTDGNTAFLLSDSILDYRAYNPAGESSYWSVSMARSWLNGYKADENTGRKDYTQDNFIDRAFSEKEKNAILVTDVLNDRVCLTGERSYAKLTYGPDTQDKVYFLSEYDMFTTGAAAYGFTKDYTSPSEARTASLSDFGYAMGADRHNPAALGMPKVSGWYMLRGRVPIGADGVCRIGYTLELCGVRPALMLNLSAADVYSYAGVVCSNSTDLEVGGSSSPQEPSESTNPPTESDNPNPSNEPGNSEHPVSSDTPPVSDHPATSDKPSASTMPTGKKGDYNGDGEVDLTDVQLTLQSYLELITPSDEQKARVDVDGNDEIDLNDVQKLLQYYLGIITEF